MRESGQSALSDQGFCTPWVAQSEPLVWVRTAM